MIDDDDDDMMIRLIVSHWLSVNDLSVCILREDVC